MNFIMHERLSPAPAPEQPVKRETKTSREKRLSWKNRLLRIAAVGLLWYASVEFKPKKEIFAQEEFPKGKIVYMSDEFGRNWDIVVSNSDGSEKKSLTSGLGKEGFIHARWHPDGRRVVLETDDESVIGTPAILIVDAQTGEFRPLPGTQGKYESDPTHKGIAYSFFGKGDDISLGFITYDGSVEKKLSPTSFLSGGQEEEVDISADGESALFVFAKLNGNEITSGIAVASLEGLLAGTEEPLFITEGAAKNAALARWNNDGEWIIFTAPAPGTFENTIYKMRSDGTEAQRLTPNVQDFYLSLGSFSPDDQFIIFSAFNPRSNSWDLFVVPSSGGEARVLFETPWNELWPDWQPRVLPERVVLVEITGLTGEVSSGGGGFVKDSLFVELESRVRRFGIRGPQIVHFSWSGNEIRNNLHYPTEQKCTDTLTDPRDRALEFLRFTDSWHAVFPADHLVFVIHSEGIQPVLYGIDKARSVLEEGGTPQEKEMINDIRWDQMTIIGGQTAALGVDKPGVEYLPLLFKESSKDCQAIFGQSPSPGLAFYPAATNLLNTWENRESRAKEIESDVRWFIENGGRLVGLGNYLDDILYIRGRAIPELGWEMRLLRNRVPEQVLTQEIPGAENHMLLLPRGHGSVYQPGPGLDLILEEFAKLTGN